MKLRLRFYICCFVLLFPLVVWNVATFENRCLFQPQASYFPDNPGHFITATPLLQERTRELYIPVEGSIKLYAWHIPAAADQPTILFVHGNGGHLGDRWQVINTFAKRGYGVLAFDYRGYSNSTGTSSEKGIYRDMFAASAYLAQELGVPPSRQIAVGESLGSAVVIESALKIPYRAVLIYSSFTSAPEVASTLAKKNQLGFLAALPPLLMRQRFENIEKISKIQMPLFIVHGAEDQLMPLWMAHQLFEEARSPDKQLMTIAQAGHNDIFQVAGEEILVQFEAFLAAANYSEG